MARALIQQGNKELYTKGNLDDLKLAWEKYDGNGDLDLKRLYDRICDLHPSGIARVVERGILKDKVWNELVNKLGKEKAI